MEGACNYDPLANFDDGTCDFDSCTGCLIAGACNYQPDAIYPGECDFTSCAGCIDACACNYDASATFDNNTCDYESCLGCIYPGALNFNEAATQDNGLCLFEGCLDPNFPNYNPSANSNFDDLCTNVPASADFNGDGIVQLEDLIIFLNVYNTFAPFMDASGQPFGCEAQPISNDILLATVLPCEGEDCCDAEGCMYPTAINYDPSATHDEGLCLFPGCVDESALNYDAIATVDNGTCTYTPCPDFNGDGLVQIVDLMNFLLLWGTTN